MTKISDFQHDAFVLRTCQADGTSRGTFKYPMTVGEMVSAPDWDPQPECGNGLHGLIDGLGDWGLIPTGDDRVWQVLGVKRDECVSLGADKVKFPRARVLYVGNLGGAMQIITPAMRAAIQKEAIEPKPDKRSRADEKPVSTSGYRSAAATTGNYSAAATTGNYSAAATTGNYSAAATTGDGSAAATTGNYSAAATTGDGSAAATTGDGSAAATTGYRSAAATTGKHSIAAALGPDSKAKASAGGAITVAAYGPGRWKGEKYIRPLLAIRSALVGQDGVEPDTWYRLNADGQFEKAEG